MVPNINQFKNSLFEVMRKVPKEFVFIWLKPIEELRFVGFPFCVTSKLKQHYLN